MTTNPKPTDAMIEAVARAMFAALVTDPIARADLDREWAELNDLQRQRWFNAASEAIAAMEAARTPPKAARPEGDDAQLIEALTNIAKSMKYGPDQAWIEEAAERIEAIAALVPQSPAPQPPKLWRGVERAKSILQSDLGLLTDAFDRLEWDEQNEVIALLTEAIARLEQHPGQWQDIVTAPKDGESIIAWGPPFQRPGEMFWDRDIERWVLPGLIPPPQNRPTHWQPLPEPPALARADAPKVEG